MDTNNTNPQGAQNTQGKKKHKKKPYYKKRKNNNSPAQSNVGEELPLTPETAEEPADTCDTLCEYDLDSMTPTVTVEDENTPKIHVAGIRFKPNGKIYFFDKGELSVRDGSSVIVETARGIEYGEVVFGDKAVPETSLVLPLRPILRPATAEDIQHNAENRQKEREALDICSEKIKSHGLEMKLVEVQYTFDNSKLLFYFTSAGRVDFRELVKDLACVFKTRIELRQIGIRDEAKIMGGVGPCGRPLCCSTFLSDFAQVSIKMAKEQNLSLNSGKISGCCGRLMCCLQYEYSTYEEESARTPHVDSKVKTPDGIGTVTETSPLTGNIKVRLDGQDTPPKTYHRDNVTRLPKSEHKEEKKSEK